MYGPYKVDGKAVPESNASFDQKLRSRYHPLGLVWFLTWTIRNAEWGLRDMEAVIEEAKKQGLSFVEKNAMPANNWTLIFSKTA